MWHLKKEIIETEIRSVVVIGGVQGIGKEWVKVAKRYKRPVIR